jgi:hypothetical protein
MKVTTMSLGALVVTSVFVLACSVASEPAPQATSTVDPEVVVNGCYHCTVTCTDYENNTSHDTDYTSCAPSLSEAQTDAWDACAAQYGSSSFPTSAEVCTYLGPAPLPLPAPTTTAQ